ncbi:MAG: 3-hydroxybutyryl-CoA dehydrogenase, partial [Desulfobacteraceae bacterium]|nr:3-hydroxybutyryl-CoA dehydrogenase [Desulfobacteraceae bacterium]
MQIKKVGIAGFSGLGSGIAQVVARAGYPVAVWDVDEQALDRGRFELIESLDGAIESGTLNNEEKESILSRMILSTELTLLKDVDLVIESVLEDLDLKKKIFSDVSGLVTEEAVLATSTSCYSVTEIT